MAIKRTGLTTLVSYPDRGEGGNHRYRGNCSPTLIEDLLHHFHPELICDYMVGSGTTIDAASHCGIPCRAYDLNRGFDLMNSEIPERSPFTFWHPPYWDIIKYSDSMYSAQSIIDRFGFDPRQTDLSRIAHWDDFVAAMNYCCMKQFAALEKGGRMAILMGDIKRKGKLYSMMAEIAKPGTLEQIIIKTQHNCWSDRQSYSGNFIPIVHEYLMIVRKDESLVFPVMLNRTVQVDVRDMKGSTWRDVIAEIMDTRTGSWTLTEIYQAVDGHEKTKTNTHWQAKIRQTLQYNPQLFQQESRGVWCRAA